MARVAAQPDSPLAPAGDARRHELLPDVVKLPQAVVIGLATSAPGQATAVAMAAMVAAGAYATGPGILLAMVPMLCIAACYQRLNRFEPNCGGPYVWVGRTLHPSLGVFVAWSMVVAFVLGSASNLLPLGPSLLGLMGLNANGRFGAVVSATIFGAAMTAIAALGIRLTARFQVLMAAIEYAILLVFSALGFWRVFIEHASGTMHPSRAWLSLSGIGGKGSLTAAMLISIFLYLGWDAPMYVNEESRTRARNPGRAVLLSVAILGPLYAWLFVSLQGVVSPQHLQANASNALVYIATALVGSGWAKVMALAIFLSVLGTTQATIVATSRVTYAMGTDALMPRRFGTVHQRVRTPLFATVFWGIASIAIADAYVLSTSLANAFDILVNDAAIAAALFWIFTAFAALFYYRSLLFKGLADTLVVGLLPLVAAGTLIWIVVKQIPTLPHSSQYGLLVLAGIGVLLIIYAARVRKVPFFSLRAATYRSTRALS